MYFVDERLNLALYTFDLGTPPFEEVRRKIEASEPPYDHPSGRDDSEDDAYQEAFENANVAIQVIGMSCVELVQTALHAFLKEFVERSFGRLLLDRVSQIKKDGWFLKFKRCSRRIPTTIRRTVGLISMSLSSYVLHETTSIIASTWSRGIPIKARSTRISTRILCSSTLRFVEHLCMSNRCW